MTDLWTSEVEKRIGIDEGNRAERYYDTQGVPTIGIGFNLQRADAQAALAQAGVPNATIPEIMNGTAALTSAQVDALFQYSFAPIVSDARAAFPQGIYDSMTDARRFVICDMVFNLGSTQFSSFTQTIDLITAAQQAKNSGAADAHEKFVAAADHMRTLAWYAQVGDRAKRNCAMMQQGVWCSPTGDGSDILGS